MTRMIQVAPVRKSLRVAASQARAFDVFANGMSRWWPPSHSILKSPLKETIVEPRVNGRWYTVGEAGDECQLGYVIVWDPPRRLVLAWQVNANWEFDPSLVTEVDVEFTADGPNATLVKFEHRNLERMGEKAESVRESIDSAGGWTAILAAFRAVAEA